MKFNKSIKIMTLALALLSTAALGACETMEGFGQDVENSGEGIENAAE